MINIRKSSKTEKCMHRIFLSESLLQDIHCVKTIPKSAVANLCTIELVKLKLTVHTAHNI